ncbi:MAG: hypothetical protein OXI43_13620 [Candidatus Poribacteria bacterium]|nr:hypothetical protein [Candidatus Poribacteria bacterium]
MKLVRFSLLWTVLAFTALSVNAGEDWKALDVGNLSSAIFNTAVVGYPENPTQYPSGWWPAGTNDSYIYEGDIWIGAKKNGEVGVAEADGRQSEIWPIDYLDPALYPEGKRDQVISNKPGVTTKGTPTGQSIRFKCADTNPNANKGLVLGLEIEVNGFQWSYAPLYDFFILEYNVKNVGEDTLEDVFMAFRYDVDVSSNETGTASYSADDFVALDQTPDGLNPDGHPNRYLSYGYSNASAPGYIGLRVLDAYVGDDSADAAAKIPFIAHKRITINTDPTTDAEKYALISTPGVEPLPANYDDQRFIQSYGPIESFAPGETFNVIIAVAIGEGLAGLQASSDWAQKLYDDEYVAPAPPPSPMVTAYPGDGQVSLLWESAGRWVDNGVNKSIEEYVDVTDPEKIFEGYRVYRRDTAYDQNTGDPVQDWELLMEFDKPSATGNFFTVSHVGKQSDAIIESMGDEPFFAAFFKSATYAIKFNSSTSFEVINTTLWEVMEYNAEFENGGGYVVIDSDTGEPYPDGTYRSGAPIYFGGLYVKITDGPSGPPVAGDIFRVVSTPSQALGEDVGIKNFFSDTGLTNGIQYTYAVTSYDTGNPKKGLPAMESSQIETMVHVVPRAHPAGYKEPSAEVDPAGKVAVTVEPMVLAPDKVTGHEYKIVWYGVEFVDKRKNKQERLPQAYITGIDYQPPAYEIVDTTTNQTVVERQTFDWYDPPHGEAVEVLSPMFDGVILKLTGVDVSYVSPTANSIIEVKLTQGSVTGWSVDIQNEAHSRITTTGPNVWWSTYYRPHTYSITFTDDTHVKVVDEDTNTEIPFKEEQADGYAIRTAAGWQDEYKREDTPDLFHIYISGAYVYIFDPNSEISAGDVFTVEMGGVAAPQDGDELLLTTQGESLAAEDIKTDLGKIRVVPNPYFVTNRAVISEGTDKVFFTHLPPRCTIRIYTLVGELVREIKHESNTPFNPDERLAQGDKGGTAEFDLLNRYNQALASGVYIFYVEAQDENNEVIGNKIGRFAIIR